MQGITMFYGSAYWIYPVDVAALLLRWLTNASSPTECIVKCVDIDLNQIRDIVYLKKIRYVCIILNAFVKMNPIEAVITEKLRETFELTSEIIFNRLSKFDQKNDINCPICNSKCVSHSCLKLKCEESHILERTLLSNEPADPIHCLRCYMCGQAIENSTPGRKICHLQCLFCNNEGMNIKC
ncbi:hypothetical protein GJ496_000579 [Pomphorhynchus laevis]|nr:hypothetical protein GJ496_000579 [Pomphorhynchus laevis]